jgi:hypothetical protein
MFALGSDGKCLDTNTFMESPIDQNASVDGAEEREGFGESMVCGGGEVTFIGDVGTPVSPLSLSAQPFTKTPDKGAAANSSTMKVKNLSRLWLYRNGGIPPDDVVRKAATS